MHTIGYFRCDVSLCPPWLDPQTCRIQSSVLASQRLKRSAIGKGLPRCWISGTLTWTLLHSKALRAGPMQFGPHLKFWVSGLSCSASWCSRENTRLLYLRSQAGFPVLFVSISPPFLCPCCNFEIKCQRTRHWLSRSKRHPGTLGAQHILLSGTQLEDFFDLREFLLYFSIEHHLLDSPCTPVLGTALQLPHQISQDLFLSYISLVPKPCSRSF